MKQENNTCILSTAYWGPIQYYTKLLTHKKVNIEVCETYAKQTYRNRMHIYGPNGMQSLQVPVQKGSFHKVLLKDTKIAYDTNWQKNHLRSIDAAYKSTPYFDFYFDDILPLYQKKPIYLLDLNNEILGLSKEMLEMDFDIEFTKDFAADYTMDDFRNKIHPKEKSNTPDINFIPAEYMQGFESRHGFIPNLSILDLIFNMGPEAGIILRNSITKGE